MEGTKDSILTMCVAGGIFMIGTLISGNKLLIPRVFTTFEEMEKDPKDGKDVMVPKIRMEPLPGNPPFAILKGDGFTYPVPEVDIFIYRLYRRVTAPQPEGEAPGLKVSLN